MEIRYLFFAVLPSYIRRNKLYRSWPVEGDQGDQVFKLVRPQFFHIAAHARTIMYDEAVRNKIIARCPHCDIISFFFAGVFYFFHGNKFKTIFYGYSGTFPGDKIFVLHGKFRKFCGVYQCKIKMRILLLK